MSVEVLITLGYIEYIDVDPKLIDQTIVIRTNVVIRL